MGQTLRKVVGSVPPRASPRAPPPASRPPSREPVQASPASVKPDEAVEPEQNMGEWDPKNPNYQTLVHQVAGAITTRPGGFQEMGPAKVKDREHIRPMPKDRHTSVASGPDEEHIVKPGTLNVAQLKQLFALYSRESEGQEKPVDVQSLAEKFNVDAVLLRKVLKHFWLHAAHRRGLQLEDPEQKQEVLYEKPLRMA